MIPVHFPEANAKFGPPEGMGEGQVKTIHALIVQLESGSCDGAHIVVTAWKPSLLDVQRLVAGGLLYFTFLDHLPPHMATTSLAEATHPS